MMPTLAARASTLSQPPSKPLPPSPPRKSSWIFGNVGWRPLPLRSGFLFVFALVTAAFIGVLEFILERSQNNGAAFFPTTVFQDHCVNYIPIIVGVLYGLAFASVDHDIKRLEPYFQLSKPGGVTAEHSLFLEYPYTLALTAPLTALRKRHWVVACSSLILLLITFGVTPLSSALLGKDSVHRTSTFPITRASFLPLGQQETNLSAAFSYAAYSAQYLNGKLPPFTTPDYGVLPFKPNDAIKTIPGELWHANTTIYEAGLNCTPGTVSTLPEMDEDGEWRGKQVQVSNADGSCKLIIESDWADKYSPYVGWMINERFIRYRSVLLYHYESDKIVQCSDDKLKDIMVGFWGRLITPELTSDEDVSQFIKYGFNKTAVVFCYPKATAQDVEVTINPEFMDVQEIQRKEATKRDFDGLNFTYWNNILVGQQSAALTGSFNLSTGMVIPKNRGSVWDSFRGATPVRKQYTGKFQGLPDHTSQLLRRPQFQTFLEDFGARPMPDQAEVWKPVKKRQLLFDYDPTKGPGLTGYIRPINTWIPNPNSLTAFGLTRQNNLEDLFDHDTLTKMFSTAYNYLFAVAIGAGLTQYDNSALARRSVEDTLAQRQYMQIGYVADLTWIRCSQIVLSVILAINTILMALLWNRKCNLSGDPGTLASGMASTDKRVLREFEDCEFMSEKELLALLKTKRYWYCLCEDMVMISQEPINPVNNNTLTLDRDKVTCHKPWSLTLWAGILSVLLLMGTVVLLIVLFVQNIKDGGFQVPGNNFQYSLYSSYLPTIAAMAFEAFLVLLAGHVALLYPFKQLRHERKSFPAGPLAINYDNIPPHFQLFGALKTRNYLLATLSTSVLLANIIAVALGVLFQKDFREFYETGSVIVEGSTTALSQFNATTLDQGMQHREYDMLYASAGDSLGFNRRPWTSDEYFYLSLADKATDPNPRANYTAKTWGIGIDITCAPLAASERNTSWYEKLVNEPKMDTYKFTQSTNAWFHQVVTPGEDVNRNWTFFAAWIKYEGDPTTIEFPSVFTSSDPWLASFTSKLDRILSESSQIPRLIPAPTITAVPAIAPAPSSTDQPNFKFVDTISIMPTRASSFRFPRATKTVTVGGTLRASSQSFARPTITNPADFMAPQVMIAGRDLKARETVSGVGKIKSNVITCNQAPKLIRRQIGVTNLTTGAIRSEDEIDTAAIPDPKDMAALNNIINNFKTMLLRVNGLDKEKTFIQPGPQNWMTYLLQKDAIQKNSDFTLYDSPEESARAMERVYKRLFAVYMQLHSNDIFNSTGKPQAEVVGSSFFRKDSRVVMGSIAFWTATALILLCVPITFWTYAVLFNGFVVHQPTSLAGTYAAFYASDALDDVAGTEGIRSAERNKRLEALGHTYGYGWFVSKDSKKHYGIHRADKKDFGWIV
ncbi:hypothetical protein FPQ18DRAFT_381258 [Pyronema domesticum]|uniref:Uncharacterized protein n=1 Tax=Pyronema omphalodes (strain CBS 100304) TaxID=1076935 RepID=U4L1I7_PYROM|nr:hypothetical protein FPQ18DRAFT_381258 [Pyronema domesticum]CCX08370.1 Similar to hypothetical protein NECHADRAFT_48925 [Nectria haematococca mpVI 77-13-4]; acc. no. XP_003050092 [Pyronema omphalodes CBS 100304]